MIIPARKKYPHLSEESDGVSYAKKATPYSLFPNLLV